MPFKIWIQLPHSDRILVNNMLQNSSSGFGTGIASDQPVDLFAMVSRYLVLKWHKKKLPYWQLKTLWVEEKYASIENYDFIAIWLHKKIIASTFRPNFSKYLTCFKILPPDLGPGIPVRDCLLPASWSVRDGQQVSQFCTWLKLHSSAYVTSEKKSLIGNKKLYELKKNMRLSKIMTLLLFDCTKKWLQSNLKTWMSAFHGEGERLIKKAISIKCTNYI